MGQEIERKFLLQNDTWRGLAPGVPYRQGYLNSEKGRTVRVRTVGEDLAYLTIKGPVTNLRRLEFEYPIPHDDALVMLAELCGNQVVVKVRYRIPYQGYVWEVDEFSGQNEGLVLAEIELSSPEETFPLPPWIGEEVSGDHRYYNSSLLKNPYRNWPATAPS